MIQALRSWWQNIGYCAGRRNGNYRTWGLRLFGKRFFWFTIDDSDSARKVEDMPFTHVCSDGLAVTTKDGPYCGACEDVKAATPKRNETR